MIHLHHQGTEPSSCIQSPIQRASPPRCYTPCLLCSTLAQQYSCLCRGIGKLLPTQNCSWTQTQLHKTLHCPIWFLPQGPQLPDNYEHHAPLYVPGDIPWPNQQPPRHSQGIQHQHRNGLEATNGHTSPHARLRYLSRQQLGHTPRQGRR
jgi:hypothetical protein